MRKIKAVAKFEVPEGASPKVLTITRFTARTPEGKELHYDFKSALLSTEEDGSGKVEVSLELHEFDWGFFLGANPGVDYRKVSPRLLATSPLVSVEYECFGDYAETEPLFVALSSLSFFEGRSVERPEKALAREMQSMGGWKA